MDDRTEDDIRTPHWLQSAIEKIRSGGSDHDYEELGTLAWKIVRLREERRKAGFQWLVLGEYLYELGRSAEHLPGEIADRIARLRYDCFVQGIETSFAESGGAWLTPERSAYIDNEVARLQQQGIHAPPAPVSV